MHLSGLVGLDEEASVRARWVDPFYGTLMGPAEPLKHEERVLFVRAAAVSAYWATSPLILMLAGSTEWRARIAASFYTAVQQRKALSGLVEDLYGQQQMLHDTFMHGVALAVLDAPEALAWHAQREGPEGPAAAALLAGGSRCRKQAEALRLLPGEPDEPAPPVARARQVAEVVRVTRKAMLAVKASLEH